MSRSIAMRIQLGLATAVLGVGLAAGTASAVTLQGCSNSDCGEVMPTNDQVTPPGGTQGETVTVNPTSGTEAERSGGTLPFTGADVAELSIVGLGAIGAGTIMVRRSRTRRATA